MSVQYRYSLILLSCISHDNGDGTDDHEDYKHEDHEDYKEERLFPGHSRLGYLKPGHPKAAYLKPNLPRPGIEAAGASRQKTRCYPPSTRLDHSKKPSHPEPARYHPQGRPLVPGSGSRRW